MRKIQLTVTLVVMLMPLTSANARSPRTDDENERIISDTEKEIPEIRKGARKEFKSIIKPTGAKVNFKDAVDKLIPFINSELTESDCKTLCIENFVSLLGKTLPEEPPACDALCKAALSKLERVVS